MKTLLLLIGINLVAGAMGTMTPSIALGPEAPAIDSTYVNRLPFPPLEPGTLDALPGNIAQPQDPGTSTINDFLKTDPPLGGYGSVPDPLTWNDPLLEMPAGTSILQTPAPDLAGNPDTSWTNPLGSIVMSPGNPDLGLPMDSAMMRMPISGLTPQAVPEPGTLVGVALGLVALARRRRKA